MKALETPEEKLARRLKKKEEKERRRRERMGWDKQDLVSCTVTGVDCYTLRVLYCIGQDIGTCACHVHIVHWLPNRTNVLCTCTCTCTCMYSCIHVCTYYIHYTELKDFLHSFRNLRFVQGTMIDWFLDFDGHSLY